MFPQNAEMERKIFSAEKKISSPSTPLRNSAEQDSSSSVLLSSSVKVNKDTEHRVKTSEYRCQI